MTKPIDLAPQESCQALAPTIRVILAALGHPEALVTDESRIRDFLNPFGFAHRFKRGRGMYVCSDGDPQAQEENRAKLVRLAGDFRVPVDANDLLVDVAQRIVSLRDKTND